MSKVKDSIRDKPEKTDRLEHIDISRSLLQVVQNNLKLANRATYLHRVIFIGDHEFLDHIPLEEVFRNSVEASSDQYTHEHLTGLLLYYTKHFVHMLEGPEEGIMRHLKGIYCNPENSGLFGRSKLLVAYHNINQRFFTEWDCRYATPPTLLATLDGHENMEEHFRHVRICIQKIYTLCQFLKEESFSEESGLIREVGEITDEVQDSLPEFALLDFLLNSPYLMDSKTYLSQNKDLTDLISFDDNVWPVPFETVPLNIFDVNKDPIQDLVKQEEEQSEDVESDGLKNLPQSD